MLFCLPGIYVAITGLGAGGGKPSSLQVANNVNAIIYAFFAVGCILVGFLLNFMKPKLCLMLASLGYPLYVGGLWYYDKSGNTWFVYLSGVVSGLSASFLWTTCAYIQFCYPEEDKKAQVSQRSSPIWITTTKTVVIDSWSSTSVSNGPLNQSEPPLARSSLLEPTSTLQGRWVFPPLCTPCIPSSKVVPYSSPSSSSSTRRTLSGMMEVISPSSKNQSSCLR